MFTFFIFPDSGLYLLNGFDFYFPWRDSENQQYISLRIMILYILFCFSASVNKDEVFKLLCDLYAAFTVLCVCQR